MTKTMTFLLASTALTIALGATAWSATRIMDDEVLPTAVQSQMDSRDLSPLIFVNDDDDEDDDRRYRKRKRESFLSDLFDF